MSKHVREECRQLCISSILSSNMDITPTKIDANWWHSNLICSTVKRSYAKYQLNMSKHVREKSGKLCISSILSSKRGITPTKIDTCWWHSDLICSTVKQSHMQKFQLNKLCKSMWEEKCGKLCISSILSSKRGLTPKKIDGNRWHSNLICSTVKQRNIQTFSFISQRM